MVHMPQALAVPTSQARCIPSPQAPAFPTPCAPPAIATTHEAALPLAPEAQRRRRRRALPIATTAALEVRAWCVLVMWSIKLLLVISFNILGREGTVLHGSVHLGGLEAFAPDTGDLHAHHVLCNSQGWSRDVCVRVAFARWGYCI